MRSFSVCSKVSVGLLAFTCYRNHSLVSIYLLFKMIFHEAVFLKTILFLWEFFRSQILIYFSVATAQANDWNQHIVLASTIS